MDDIIELLRQAVKDAAGSPWRPTLLDQLGFALLTRYNEQGNLADLTEAITMLEDAVESGQPGSIWLSLSLDHLGWALQARYTRRQDRRDLDRAIELAEQAQANVAGTPSAEKFSPGNLGTALMERYHLTGDERDLDRAIEIFRRSADLQAAHPDPTDADSSAGSLGFGLMARYRRLGELSDLERAIAAFEQALSVIPPASGWRYKRYMALNNLAWGLTERFELTESLDDLYRAHELYSEAVDEEPVSAPNWAGHRYNLAMTKARISEYSDDPAAGLVEAIGLAEQLIDMPSLGPAERLLYRSGVAGCYAQLAQNLSLIPAAERAIELLEPVVRDAPPGSPEYMSGLANLGGAYMIRHDLTADPADLRRGCETYRLACAAGLEDAPGTTLSVAYVWTGHSIRRQAWPEAAEAAGYGLRAMQRLFHGQLTRAQKEASLRASYRQARHRLDVGRGTTSLGAPTSIGALAGYAKAMTGDLRGAAEALDGSRALLLNEVLERDLMELDNLELSGNAGAARRYRSAAASWAELSRQADTGETASAAPRRTVSADALRAARIQMDACLAEIRAIPGSEMFQAEPIAEEIASAASADAPLVYLAATALGGLALVVGADNYVIWLPELREDTVTTTARAFVAASRESRSWPDDLDSTLMWLWDSCMGHLLERLEGIRCATLIPSGLLELLPLHAAWTRDTSSRAGRRYVIDQLSLAYAPTARALKAAGKRASRIQSRGVLVVADPRPTRRASSPEAISEATAVRASYRKSRSLQHDAATAAAVQTELPNWPVLHFACHGFADLEEPLSGGLVLSNDEVLTLRQIHGLHLNCVRLAVLSACETAVPGLELPDEVIGLPTALQSAGAAAAIGSLWRVGGSGTPLLMARFHQLWNNGADPRDALREAQIWVRDTTNGQKHATFPGLLASAREGLSPPALRLWEEARLHTHPSEWAAFVLVGA